MKKTFTLLSMLLCFFAGVHAQTTVSYVSETATPYSELVSGKEYAILVASDKNCTGADYSTARFLPGSGTSTAFADAYSSTNDLRGAIAASNYIWVVTINSDNTIKINVKNGNYIPAPPSNGQGGGGLSTTGGNFTRLAGPTENADWCYLTAGTVTVSSEVKTVYLTLGGSKGSSANRLEYWHYATGGSYGTNEVAKFKFFAIEEGLETVNLTYNYTINGTKVGSNTVTGAVGKSYPAPTGLPDFVTGTAPTGTVTADAGEQTVELNLTNYPFPFSLNESDEAKWGYLSVNISTAGRCFLTAGDKIAHSSTGGKNVNATLNNVQNDMWRMVGNPFDGFKIINKNGKCLVKQSNNGAALADASTTASDNLWKIYGGDIMDTPGNVTDANATELKAKAFVVRGSAVNEGNNYLDGGGASSKTALGVYQKRSNGSCFLFWEPEFTVALNTTDNLDAAYATLCMPVDFKVTTEGVKAYTGKYSEGTLSMTAVEGGVAANQGVVLRSADKSVTTVTLTANATAATTTTSDNDLQGTTAEIAFADLSDKLVFGVSSSNKVGFFSASGSAALPANRAYLNKSLVGGGAEGAAIMMNFDGKYTGIDAIEGVKAMINAPIYDLTGRRVVRTVKGGLYIQGGKKFIAQ